MALGFLRYFAITDPSFTGYVALAYLKSLLRIAPVRLISKSGDGLEPPWNAYQPLTMTAMAGTYVNCVAVPPEQLTWDVSVPMPAANLGAQGAALASEAPKLADTARGRAELYTASARNVLFVVWGSPRIYQTAQLDAIRKYEAIVVNHSNYRWWADEAGIPRDKLYAGRVTDPGAGNSIAHDEVRAAILGRPAPSDGIYR